MLSCKNCGAQMSGTDLICKKCGTPWGKKHKSYIHIYLSIFLILFVGVISYIYFNPNIDKTKLIESLSALIQKEQTDTENNTSISSEEELQQPIEQAPEPPQEDNTAEPEASTPEQPVEGNTPPAFPWVSASSSLKSQGKFSYTPELTLDDKMETAWLEGASGNGIGEYLLYSAESNQKLSEIVLYNGYLKNNITYINNGRAKNISVEFSDGTIITQEIPKQTYNESLAGYTIKLAEPINTASVKITILDVYKGSYYTDTAISDISFR